jgi:hypothetical protein
MEARLAWGPLLATNRDSFQRFFLGSFWLSDNLKKIPTGLISLFEANKTDGTIHNI